MSDNYDPLTTQNTAITFRRLDALQDSVAAFGKTSSGAPVAILVASDGTLQVRRLNRLTDEVVLIGTDSGAIARPVLGDTLGRLNTRPLSAAPVADFDALRAFFLGPAAAQVQGKADADGTINVNDSPARASLASILAQLDITQSALRDAITSPSPNARTLADLYGQLASILGQLNLTTTVLRDAITGGAPSNKTLFGLDQDLVAALQATQPRSVTNFPSDYPDAMAEARLQSILNQLDTPLTAHRDAITTSLATDQPRHVTNFPTDFPDALTESRLASILGQLDVKMSQLRDGIAGAGVSTKSVEIAIDGAKLPFAVHRTSYLKKAT